MRTPGVSGRSLRLATACAFILGIALFGVGLVLAFTVSWTSGSTVFLVGAVLMVGSRFVARKFKLPAP